MILSLVIATPLQVQATEASNINARKKNAQSLYSATRFKEAYTIINVTRTTQSTTLEFPENYGGIYIDYNNDLHIAYTNEIETLLKVNLDSNVFYDKVDFSYNYLNTIYNCLSNNLSHLSISKIYIDEIDNCVKISTNLENTDNISSYLKQHIIDFEIDAIKYLPSVEFVKTDLGGTSIKADAGFTLGYNAYSASTEKYGFITCGHGVTGIGDKVYRNTWFGENLGTVEKWQYSNTIDAAFIPYKDQTNATTATKAGYELTGTFSAAQITVGMKVDKYGSATELQHGTITATQATINVDGNIFTDQVEVSISQKKGDSGAPVVYNLISPDFIGPLLPDQEFDSTLLGIATFGIADTWNTAWVSKAENINNAFGLSTYIIE